MPPSEQRTPTWLIPAAMVCTLVALVLFRHVVSLDGPMHLLHGSLLWEAWRGGPRLAEGIFIDIRKMDLNLGDIAVIPLIRALPPFLAHKLFATFAILLLYLGAWRMAKVHSSTLRGAWLLVLPLAFGFPMLLGLFHFIIASGTALLCAAWWVGRKAICWRDLLGLFACIALCQFAHGIGGVLIVCLVGTHELTEVMRSRSMAAQRWKDIPTWFIAGISALLMAVAVFAVQRNSLTAEVWSPEPHDPIGEFLRMRPLLLFDSAAEGPFRIAFGALLVIALCWTIAERWRTVRGVRAGDSLLLASMGLILMSFVIRTPKAELLYLAERTQWLALLLLCIWLGMQRFPGRIGFLFAVCVLVLHAVRLVYIERRMAHFEGHDRSMIEAATHLSPHSFVVPVGLDSDWLVRHRTAYTALGHEGILFSARDHVRFGGIHDVHWTFHGYLFSAETDWHWLENHMEKRYPPRVEHVLVMGHANDTTDLAFQNLGAILSDRFERTWHDDYAEVWTCRQAK
jgi:hypothetical protein